MPRPLEYHGVREGASLAAWGRGRGKPRRGRRHWKGKRSKPPPPRGVVVLMSVDCLVIRVGREQSAVVVAPTSESSMPDKGAVGRDSEVKQGKITNEYIGEASNGEALNELRRGKQDGPQ